MLIQQNIDRNKEIYPVCIFEGFIGKEVFLSKMVSLSMMFEYLMLIKIQANLYVVVFSVISLIVKLL